MKKKYVQTSLFESKITKESDLYKNIQNFMQILDNLDIDALSHQDLKDKVMELKKKNKLFPTPKQQE